MEELISETTMRERFAAYVATFPTRTAAARDLGASPQYVGDILAGRRDVSDQVARKLGYRRVVSYGLNPPQPTPGASVEGEVMG